MGEVPSQPTAADLIEEGLDYSYYRHWPERRACFEEAAALDPGSRDSARALMYLAETYSHEGDQERADALFAQAVAECPDPEIAALADLQQGLFPLYRANDLEAAQQLLVETEAAWRGTELGGYATLRLADIQRYAFEDYDEAIALFESLVETHSYTRIVEEAALGIAESVGCAGDLLGAIPFYEDLADGATIERIRLRALVGIADCLVLARDWAAAATLASEIIAAYPDRPVAGFAHILRSCAAKELGAFDMAAEDARAYLRFPGRNDTWSNFAHLVLGQEAYREGRLEDAEQEFALVTTSPGNERYAGRAYAALAECRFERGDLAGAVSALFHAADHPARPIERSLYLYQAALMANRAGDATSASQAADLLISECPGSVYATRLLGGEILPEPAI